MTEARRNEMMGANKKYSGYTSWQFFEPGKDYRPFRLARVLNRVPSTVIQLSKAEEEKVAKIIEKNILISFHDHAEIFPEDPKDFIEYERVGAVPVFIIICSIHIH